MRLIMRPVAIAAILFLAFPPIAKPVAAAEGKAAPHRAQRPPISLEQHPECDTVIAELHKSGAAAVSIRRWTRGQCFSSSSEWVEPLRLACSLAELASYCPHRLGAIDLMSLAAPTMDVPSYLDETLFGCEEDCTVELWDSPSLVANLELVSRLPELGQVTVYTKRTDEHFLKAVRRVKVSGGVKQRDPADRALKSGLVRGVVVDSNGKPVAGATVMIRSPSGEIVIGSWTNDDGIFSEWNIRNVPYRIEAFAPPSWSAGPDSKVASSEPVNAKPGANVRLVIDPARLASQPPKFHTVEDDDGKRIVLDPSDEAGSP